MSVLHPNPNFGNSGLAGSTADAVLPGVLVLAGIASLLVVGLAIAAFAQRRSQSYLLIALALATLLVRTIVGGLTVNRLLPRGTHHTAEHALDVVMATLLVAAVYCARTADQPSGGRA